MVGVEVLRSAQHDKIPCHPERSEGLAGWSSQPLLAILGRMVNVIAL
jgi:hypothetical protein